MLLNGMNKNELGSIPGPRSPVAELRRLRHLAGRLHLGLPHPRHHAVQQDVHREGQGGRQEGSSGKTSRNNLFKVIDAVVQ